MAIFEVLSFESQFLIIFSGLPKTFECLNNATKHCDFNGGTLIDLIDKARQQMSFYWK